MTPYQNNSFNNRGTIGFNNRSSQTQNAPRPPKPEDTVKVLPAFNVKTRSKELFDTIAETCAKTIAESSESINKPTQLRRFYDELVMWNERASISDEAFQNALPFVYMMKSKAAYAKGRKNVDATFLDFIKTLIGQIEDKDTLNNAKLFMEAMMGFYKQYKRD
mgnify:CR=1 FL=1